MAVLPVPDRVRLKPRWHAHLAAVAILAGSLSLLPTVSLIAPEVPLLGPTVATAAEGARTDKRSVPVRVRVPYAGVDLPVVSSERTVRGNPTVAGTGDPYPLCDVAQYWTRFDLPGAPGSTWIYAHAQPGMFLPLFTISDRSDGKELLGKTIELQTRDGRLLTYRINEVKERAGAGNYEIAKRDRANEHRVVLQTSTGPPGTKPKLQVAGTLISAETTTKPAPKAKPRACAQPRATPTKKPRNGKPTPTPEPVVIEDDASVDPMTLALGSAAVLLGATLVAIYLVRRQP